MDDECDEYDELPVLEIARATHLHTGEALPLATYHLDIDSKAKASGSSFTCRVADGPLGGTEVRITATPNCRVGVFLQEVQRLQWLMVLIMNAAYDDEGNPRAVVQPA